MPSKSRHEGYLLIDHKDSPGVPQALIDQARRAGKEVLPSPSGSFTESATYTCAHCNTIVILNPQRTRERHYCTQCDHYICDVCAELRRATGCKPFRALLDTLQEKMEKCREVSNAGVAKAVFLA